MVFYKSLYLIPFFNSLFYIEGNSLLFFSVLNTSKMRVREDIMLENRNFQFFFYKTSFISLDSFIIRFKEFFFYLNSFFFRSFIGYSNGFRLLGRGYKVLVHLNVFLFRLGYSHNIYYLLPLEVRSISKSKLKKFWIIKGFNPLLLSNVVYFLRSLKMPGMYMHKGIYPKNKLIDYKTKFTKIGFM